MDPTVVPLFYLHTAADILAIPEPVLVSSVGNSIEPHSCLVTLVSLPSLEEGIGAASRRAVVTLILSGTPMQTRVVATGEILRYSTVIYGPPASVVGTIYARVRQDVPLEIRRIDILRRLNRPDYEVIGLPDGSSLPTPTGKTVHILDGAMLRIPVREVVRQFASLFASTDTIVAPGIASFTGFSTSVGLTAGSTSFIALPELSSLLLAGPTIAQTALDDSLPPLVNPEYWQEPIKMSSASWTTIGILWGLVVVTFIISVGVAYIWYLKQIL